MVASLAMFQPAQALSMLLISCSTDQYLFILHLSLSKLTYALRALRRMAPHRIHRIALENCKEEDGEEGYHAAGDE